MKFAIVTHSLPQPNSNGGPMTVWATLEHLLKCGHEVAVFSLVYAEDPFGGPERAAAVRATGATLHEVRIPSGPRKRRGLRAVFGPAIDFHSAAARPEIVDGLRRFGPAAVFLYHWDSLAVVHGIAEFPKLAAVGDPWHLPALRAWENEPPQWQSPAYWRRSAAIWLARRRQPRIMHRMLADCDAYGTYQAHETAVFQRSGLPRCQYFRTPVSDPLSGGVTAAPERRGKPSVLLGPSNLEATSTRHGIVYFAREILPRMERQLGADAFVVRIVGEGKPPPDLARLLPRPSIELTGRIEPPDREFLNCRAQLVPTPFVLGIRVRIITGMAFGTCIVAHDCERANIPELRTGENSLLGGDGASLADALVRVLRDRSLSEQLGRAARREYERSFAPNVAVQPVLAALQEIAGRRTTHTSFVTGAS